MITSPVFVSTKLKQVKRELLEVDSEAIIISSFLTPKARRVADLVVSVVVFASGGKTGQDFYHVFGGGGG